MKAIEKNLKSCPFCGGKAKIEHIDDSHLCYAICTKCHATAQGFFDYPGSNGEEKSVHAWNRRAGEPPAADVQEVEHGEWQFHEKTKLVPANMVGIKEEYTNGHDCTVVDNTNVNNKIMIMKKRITLKIPICSVCGWCGHDECDATPYCPCCGARMDGADE